MDGWTTVECCNETQLLRLSWIGTFTVLLLAMWGTPLLYPCKLFAYFTHEAFRSAAARLTCGQVEAIDIHPEEGSETSFHGGLSTAVHLAGYVGSLGLGCVFVVSSALDLPRAACGVIIVLMLLAFTTLSNTRYLRTINALSLTVAVSAGGVSYFFQLPQIVELMVLLAGVLLALLYIVDASWNGSRVHPSDFALFRKACGLPMALVGALFALILCSVAVLVQTATIGVGGGPPAHSLQDLSLPTVLSCAVFVAAVALAATTSAVKCLCRSVRAKHHSYCKV